MIIATEDTESTEIDSEKISSSVYSVISVAKLL